MLIFQRKAVELTGLTGLTGLVFSTLFSTLSATIVLNSAVIGPAQAEFRNRSGADGPSKTIFLESSPQPISIDLSGQDGSAGRRGGNAYSYGDRESEHEEDWNDRRDSSKQCHNSDVGKVARNITMTSGKNGSNGEDGGKGGNGGNLTVYYQNRSDLKQIWVNAAPGRGGPGGRGGRGSKGCDCPKSSWTIDGKTYTCTDGRDGLRGSRGADGANGRMGRLRLIAGQTPIAGDTPEVRMSLEKMINLPSIPLSLNRWDTHQGALSLLQVNSRIDDEYQEYRDRLEKTAKIAWRAQASSTDYGSQVATLQLQNSGQINFQWLDRGLWSKVEQIDSPKGTTVAIDAVVHERDAVKLTAGITEKHDREFTLAVIDMAAKSDILETRFSVKVMSRSSNARPGDFGNTTTHYEGVLPPTAVKRDYNRFLLNLGSLPVPDETFKVGNDVAVEIQIIRSLGTRSATQTIDWSGTVY